jgi:hypothetical protein
MFDPSKRLADPKRAQVTLKGHAMLFFEPVSNPAGIQSSFLQVTILNFEVR